MSAGAGAVVLVGRVLFSIFFVRSGWGHLTKGKGMIGYAETAGLPVPYLAGWPSGVETVVVMLDGGRAFQTLDATGIRIWWGAYLGMPDQIVMSGALAEVGPRIVAARQEARGRHGWIMDSYILKRRP